MDDVAKAAKDVVLSLQPVQLEEELRQDAKYAKYAAPLAIERVRHIEHFTQGARDGQRTPKGSQRKEEGALQ